MAVRHPFTWLSRIAAIAAIPFGLLTFSIPAADALPPTTWTKYYFSDSDFQNWVGEKSLFCDGSRYQDGIVTGHSLIVVQEGCTGGAPDGIQTTYCYVWWPPNGPMTIIPCR